MNQIIQDAKDLLAEFDGEICVSDFGLNYKGTRIDIVRQNGDSIEFWAGNPEDRDMYGHYAEQLILDSITAEDILLIIMDLM